MDLMDIIWISGKGGYGKTAFAYSLIKAFRRKGKTIYKLNGSDFRGCLIGNIQRPVEGFLSQFQEYDLLVVDDMDYGLLRMPVTQKVIKRAVREIAGNNKTTVVLITQKRARKLRRVKFASSECRYIRLKTPSLNFKRELFIKWLRRGGFTIRESVLSEVIKKADNLFQLRGLFNQITCVI